VHYWIVRQICFVKGQIHRNKVFISVKNILKNRYENCFTSYIGINSCYWTVVIRKNVKMGFLETQSRRAE
jgi:hypothetical protein